MTDLETALIKPETEENKETEPKDEEAVYNFSGEKGRWQPKPGVILSMFEKLSQGIALPLKWKCPGRRLPTKDDGEITQGPEKMEVDEEEVPEEDQRAPEKSAFDFDESQSDISTNLSPRRTPGFNRTPKTEKRVARMDNIMDSLRKQQLQRVAARDARRSKGSPVAGRGRFMTHGSPRQAITSSSPVRTSEGMVTISSKPLTPESKSPQPGMLVNQNETAVSTSSSGGTSTLVPTEASVLTTAQESALATSTDTVPSAGNDKIQSEHNESSVVSSTGPTLATATPSTTSSTIFTTTTETSTVSSCTETTLKREEISATSTTTSLSTEAVSTLPTTEAVQTPLKVEPNQTQQNISSSEAPNSQPQAEPTPSDPGLSSTHPVTAITTPTTETSTSLSTTHVAEPPNISPNQKEPQTEESGSFPQKSSPSNDSGFSNNNGQSQPAAEEEKQAEGEKN